MSGIGGMNWIGILRCGLVQTCIGAIVVLSTSTYKRVMVVELALPAMLPGALVALHYAVEMARPRWGYGSDMGGGRVPWIRGGMAILAIGTILASGATVWMGQDTWGGIALAVVSFVLIGIGAGAAGTSLLALLAARVAPERCAAAASITWIMLIAGIAVTATLAGKALDPFGPVRLMLVASTVGGIAVLVTVIATWGLERGRALVAAQAAKDRPSFRVVLAETWGDDEARRFAFFVFLSMLAYNTQDLILEPFAGLVLGMTPGESTQLTGVQHGGVFLGMIIVALAGSGPLRGYIGSLRGWTVWGCVGSGVAMGTLALSGTIGPSFLLEAAGFCLGLANGAFAVAAIGSMMKLAGAGREDREGVRIGLWGAAQAVAFGLAGFMGTVLVDLLRQVFETPESAYGGVFAFEALLFLMSAVLAARIRVPEQAAGRLAPAE